MAGQRWQPVITTDNYRCFVDSQTIYSKRQNHQKVIFFKLQKIYWQPQQLEQELKMLDASIDWKGTTYSVEQDSYNVNRHMFWSGDIAFFSSDGRYIGLIRRDQWQAVVAQSELDKMCQRVVSLYEKE